MDISLNWDVVLIGIIILLFGYNFIIGQKANIKLIFGLYMAAFATDGLLSLAFQALPPNTLGESEENIFLITRLALFLFFNVIFVMKGAFQIALKEHDSWIVKLFLQMIFSASASILFIAFLLIGLSGHSFAEGLFPMAKIPMFAESQIAHLLVHRFIIWFTIPPIVFIISSFAFPNEE